MVREAWNSVHSVHKQIVQEANRRKQYFEEFFLVKFEKALQIDSMLPCVCSVIDHRWRQNVIRTKKCTRGDSPVCHWCSYHILTSSVIYYWTDARQHGTYLFYTIKKQTTTKKLFYFKMFQRDPKAGLCPALCPLWQTRKKAIWHNLLSIQM